MLIPIGPSPLVTSMIMFVIPRAGAFLSSFSAQRGHIYDISGRASSIASDSPICTMLGPLNNLKGKVAVVTGASRGIGKGIAVTLGERGCTVYVTGRSAEGATTDKARSGHVKLRVLWW